MYLYGIPTNTCNIQSEALPDISISPATSNSLKRLRDCLGILVRMKRMVRSSPAVNVIKLILE